MSLNNLGTEVVVDAFRQIGGLEGILCFGSHALGTFDADSDVDLYVVWRSEVPSPETRREVISHIKGIEALDIEHIEPGWHAEDWFPHCDRFLLNGALFDTGHNTTNWLTEAVKNARTFPQNPNGRKYLNILALLDNSLILHDHNEYLAGLVSQVYPFPLDLRDALISENMTIMKGSLEDLLNYVRRGIGNTALLFHLMRAVGAIRAILFAVNGKYDPAAKRVEEELEKLSLTPPSFSERYSDILSTALNEEGRKKTVRELALLAQDIEDLVKNVRVD